MSLGLGLPKFRFFGARSWTSQPMPKGGEQRSGLWWCGNLLIIKERFFVVFLRRQKQKKGGAPVQEKDEQWQERNRAKQENVTGEMFISPVPVWSWTGVASYTLNQKCCSVWKWCPTCSGIITQTLTEAHFVLIINAWLMFLPWSWTNHANMLKWRFSLVVMRICVPFPEVTAWRQGTRAVPPAQSQYPGLCVLNKSPLGWAQDFCKADLSPWLNQHYSTSLKLPTDIACVRGFRLCIAAPKWLQCSSSEQCQPENLRQGGTSSSWVYSLDWTVTLRNNLFN